MQPASASPMGEWRLILPATRRMVADIGSRGFGLVSNQH